MSISIRLNEQENELIKNFAKVNNMSVSEFIRKTVMERIEDEIDLEDYKKAMSEYKKNPKTYSMKEMAEELGL
ncbi:MAG: CopG family transcriptional regulator [Phascolarctobacterium sp.]|nr:MAG: CopG family transcriptional regulator [Phascolarctobacterium sp.]